MRNRHDGAAQESLDPYIHIFDECVADAGFARVRGQCVDAHESGALHLGELEARDFLEEERAAHEGLGFFVDGEISGVRTIWQLTAQRSISRREIYALWRII